jgi:hypothetical protein
VPFEAICLRQQRNIKEMRQRHEDMSSDGLNSGMFLEGQQTEPYATTTTFLNQK